eukprot:ANDGO_03791.mRNA.1 Uncharacterized protein C800.13
MSARKPRSANARTGTGGSKIYNQLLSKFNPGLVPTADEEDDEQQQQEQEEVEKEIEGQRMQSETPLKQDQDGDQSRGQSSSKRTPTASSRKRSGAQTPAAGPVEDKSQESVNLEEDTPGLFRALARFGNVDRSAPTGTVGSAGPSTSTSTSASAIVESVLATPGKESSAAAASAGPSSVSSSAGMRKRSLRRSILENPAVAQTEMQVEKRQGTDEEEDDSPSKMMARFAKAAAGDPRFKTAADVSAMVHPPSPKRVRLSLPAPSGTTDVTDAPQEQDMTMTTPQAARPSSMDAEILRAEGAVTPFQVAADEELGLRGQSLSPQFPNDSGILHRESALSFSTTAPGGIGADTPKSAAKTKAKKGPRSSEPFLPASLVSSLFKSSLTMRASKDALAAVMDASKVFFEHAAKDVVVFADKAKRKTVDAEDFALLLKKQRLLPESGKWADVLRSHLPMEAVESLVPKARSDAINDQGA